METEKSAAQVKEEYASMMVRAKLVSAITLLLISPRLILGFTDLNSFLGLNYVTALIPMLLGTIVYVVFFKKYWRCPACLELPGGGWTRKQCKHCGVALR
ncbi:hypothetical protein HPT27_01925 [Permianibacter sp. IMCC34836]|uniref:hypothetical protein n=1 Tax=Permianibacter fluminis TaxID=2738515 RepID=UPI0015547115|nr:hypothetical protein [Permianibacter fluminis]NQD35760.1 hypothetical protein [Permianibacter fluminis]